MTFSGPFAIQCEVFLSLKRAQGHKYESEAHVLQNFDKTSAKCDCKEGLTKEVVLDFIRKRTHETPKSRDNRVYVMREFAAFLNRSGFSAYIPEHQKHLSSFVPYIFSEEEIVRLLSYADNIEETRSSKYAHLVYPALFRMLYGCGLRVSEAISLKVGDVNLKDGLITIRNAKFGKDRIVVMSGSLRMYCNDYAEKIHLFSNEQSWFFPCNDNSGYVKGSVYSRFRILLQQSGISHGGRGKGPRLHDIRHTFSVHCLNKWVQNHNDPIVLLPVLSAYLGHSKVSATEKYLRLIPQMNQDIMQKTEKIFPNIIPSVEAFRWEVCEIE